MIPCPICKKENCVDDRCYRNVEFYGNNIFSVPCVHCSHMLRVNAHRYVKIVSIKPSLSTKSDFGPDR